MAGGHEVAKLPRQDKAALPGLLYYSIRVKLAVGLQVGSWVKYTGQLNQIETVPQVPVACCPAHQISRLLHQPPLAASPWSWLASVHQPTSAGGMQQ